MYKLYILKVLILSEALLLKKFYSENENPQWKGQIKQNE